MKASRAAVPKKEERESERAFDVPPDESCGGGAG